MDTTADFQTVLRGKKGSKARTTTDPRSKPVQKSIVVPAKGTIVDTYNNRKQTFRTDQERLAYCTEHNVPFKIFTTSEVKDTMRKLLGNKANRELNRTETVERQKKSNDAIFHDVTTRARSRPDSAITYLLYCAHAVLKNHNIGLLTSISNHLVKNYGLTMAQVLDSRYGDSEFSLLNTAAWNLDKAGMAFCVSNGADIDFVNKSGENIDQVMRGGYRQRLEPKQDRNGKLIPLDEMSKRLQKTHYNNCIEYISELRQLQAEEKTREALPEVEIFKFTPKEDKSTKKEAKTPTKTPAKATTKAPTNAFSAFEDDSDEEEKDEENTINHNFDDAGKEYVATIMGELCELYMDDAPVEQLRTIMESKSTDMCPELIEFMRSEFDNSGF